MINEEVESRANKIIAPGMEAHGLSAREREVIHRAREGATDKQIAEAIGISIPTLRSCWNGLRDKLGAVNRTHAISLAGVGQRVPAANDLRARLIDSLIRNRLSTWVWKARSRHALLDEFGCELFALPPSESPIPLDHVLAHIWAPDRARFERYLQQGSDIRLMTPIELRVGVPGDYRNLIRTVNLAAEIGSDPSLLLASTTLHVFKP